MIMARQVVRRRRLLSGFLQTSSEGNCRKDCWWV